ncbi:MurR/RpiR family transcriptional regulator [Helcobacillus massiliensis]|uniref:MurR/RpiR family transcriptional regulator n=1 Tax=Helcobacillus TaxID=1161125 RepID=UPI001EF61298|nr:MurR/RpiR family transcriptional regulator [Helcobacillus massiliensis]MCG7426987.1 MurR/RpiR family transcriptional regulator [Helcobacillus sp. ACRRO]MCT1557007.1 MurR/RpiR family transcriptional regulator [Helcobacillus massiliensis]MCT2035396.1 MurR/RpiR family transcriptional regulator [Helcobacillus massiliensis]MCT2331389.1 MurR/RpiR family transcriptional regulator [Helcobacillus massiliensis]MDK7741075.1 MurR/RpiR family transcriptional regulator [Helcobacillus massiliensis]
MHDQHRPSVLRLIRDARPTLPPAVDRVARLLLADPSAAAAMTISEVAREAGSSEASAVRLARELRLSGYRELRSMLRTEIAFNEGRTASFAGDAQAQMLGNDLSASDTLAETVAKIAFADARAVQDTADQLDLDALGRAVDTLASAQRIVTFGVGASAFAALDLQQKLARIGRSAVAFTDVHQGLPGVALLDGDDAAVIVSHSGFTTDAIDVLAAAKRAGVRTVGVTNAGRSPLSEGAGVVLLTAAQESEMRSGATASRIAQLSVVDMLFIATAQRDIESARSALSRTYLAISRGRSAG